MKPAGRNVFKRKILNLESGVLFTKAATQTEQSSAIEPFENDSKCIWNLRLRFSSREIKNFDSKLPTELSSSRPLQNRKTNFNFL